MIEIWTEELPPSWHWTPDNYLGGTPETVIHLAKNLPDDVCVYYDGPAGEYDGVFYLSREDYMAKDILIAFNSVPEKLAKYNIYSTSWVHARDTQYDDFDERIVLSDYHRSLFGMNSRVVPLSCDPVSLVNGEKVRGRCLFSSSPDRGRDFLESIWPEIEDETDAELITTYSHDITELEMSELYRTSQFWLHPGDGIELFCISALKAQVAGCIPVVVPNMALDTTVKFGVRTTKEMFQKTLIDAIKNPPPVEPIQFITWKEVAAQYLVNIGVTHGT